MILSTGWDLVPYSNLLEVQKEVFEYFTDLRNITKSLSTKLDCGFDVDTPYVDLVCTCILIPEYGITASDVKLFKQLLLKMSSEDENKSSYLRKREMSRIQKLHSLILQAQISVQRQLELATPCSHNGLTLTNEKILLELQAKEQNLYISSLPIYYKLKGIVKSIPSFSAVAFTFSEFLQLHPFMLKIPSIEKFVVNSQTNMAYYLESMFSFPTLLYKQIHHSVEYMVLLTENVLTFLFLLKGLVGIYLPFDLTVEKSGASFSRKTIQFGNILLTVPLSPRVRTRLFYEIVVKQHLSCECDSSDQDRLNYVPIINTDEKCDVSAPRILRSYTKTQESDISVTKLDPSEDLDYTDDELRIDLDGMYNNDHSSKQSDTSVPIPGNLTNFCTVVEGRRNMQLENMKNISASDFSSAPASPTDEPPESPCAVIKDPKSSIHSPSPLIIPLEPIESVNELSQESSASLEAFNSSKHANVNSPKLSRISKSEINLGSHKTSVTECSYSSLRIGNKNLIVQFYDTVWSNSESCLACTTSPSYGHCPLWPSCSTRDRSCSRKDDMSKKPIFVQIKPEYLGDWGCEILENQELELSWLGSLIRNNSDILRIRIFPNSGKVIWAEYQSMEEMLKAHPHFKPQENLNRLSGLLDQLFNLQPGSYMLTQSKDASDDLFDIYQPVNNNQSFDVDAHQIDLHQISNQFSTSSERLLDLLSSINNKAIDVTVPEEIASTLYLVRRLRLDLDIPAGFEVNTSESIKSERNLKLPGLIIDRMEKCTNGSESAHKLTCNKSNKTTKKKPSRKSNSNDQEKQPLSQNVIGKHLRKRKRSK
ncbi:hypothetical protein MN116_002173 [Schistosoma mekongi]|uniref:Little elongation complex subunit 2 C-terminal domain-containing protein n=1 Tax=Schistosoma mekongi TaxID=38744 RepID=A0AAE1ZJ82_SCHME|nr:hypothetical protein MN116_002173 [Schistosoma mekongi]